MSYLNISTKTIEVDLPYSASLHKIKFNQEERVIQVAYEGNPDFFYTHENCTYEDFASLVTLIEDFQSGHGGYEEWKDRRKKAFQRQDNAIFNTLWESMNEYQRTNLIDFVNSKKHDHWREILTPINKRR